MAVAVRLLFFMGLEISEYGGFFSVRSLFVRSSFGVRCPILLGSLSLRTAYAMLRLYRISRGFTRTFTYFERKRQGEIMR